jgi:hypothetical protein
MASYLKKKKKEDGGKGDSRPSHIPHNSTDFNNKLWEKMSL